VCVCVCVCVCLCIRVHTHTHTHTRGRYGRPLGGGEAASHTDTSEIDLATINRIIANMDGATATSSAGNMEDTDNDLRCHFLQYDISLEGVQKLRNAGVCRLSDFHYIQSSDVRNMNMSLLDQRKTEKMLESWHAMHQDALRGPLRAPEQQITPATAANGTHGTLEDARDELPEPAFPFEEDLGASHPHGDKFSC
jgi:hypothetical protein